MEELGRRLLWSASGASLCLASLALLRRCVRGRTQELATSRGHDRMCAVQSSSSNGRDARLRKLGASNAPRVPIRLTTTQVSQDDMSTRYRSADGCDWHGGSAGNGGPSNGSCASSPANHQDTQESATAKAAGLRDSCRSCQGTYRSPGDYPSRRTTFVPGSSFTETPDGDNGGCEG